MHSPTTEQEHIVNTQLTHSYLRLLAILAALVPVAAVLASVRGGY